MYPLAVPVDQQLLQYTRLQGVGLHETVSPGVREAGQGFDAAADWTAGRGADSDAQFGGAAMPQPGDAEGTCWTELAGGACTEAVLARFDGRAGIAADSTADAQVGVAAIPQAGDAKGVPWTELAGGGCTETVLANFDGSGAEHHPT